MVAKRVAIGLLVGATLTLVWIFVCPTYQTQGQTHEVTSSSYTNGGTATEHRSEEYNHLDADVFWAGELIIWAISAAILILNFETWRASRFEPPV